MILTPIKVKAPGSMMIMGEHAVLHKQPALVTAIDRWMTLTLSPKENKQLSIESVYGKVQQSFYEKPQQPWAQWICFIIQSFLNDLSALNEGLQITIESTFEGAVGLSSSTALTVSLLYALAHWIDPASEEKQKKQWVFAEAMDLLQQFNKIASGAALQAIIYGGLRYFDSEKKQSQLVDNRLSSYLVYAGYKTPTEQVVQIIKEKFSHAPIKLNQLYDKMGLCVKQAYEALQNNDMDFFYQAIDNYYALQKQLGTSDKQLDQMIMLSRQSQNTLAAKISGAGLGDCILVFGKMDKHLWRSMQETQIIEVHGVDEGVHAC